MYSIHLLIVRSLTLNFFANCVLPPALPERRSASNLCSVVISDIISEVAISSTLLSRVEKSELAHVLGIFFSAVIKKAVK
jgi:hypothetical protein